LLYATPPYLFCVTDISEGEFLEVVTKAENVACHFYHRDFERCKIIDAHLAQMCKRFMEIRFIKVSAPVSQQAAWGLQAGACAPPKHSAGCLLSRAGAACVAGMAHGLQRKLTSVLAVKQTAFLVRQLHLLAEPLGHA
jgi:hypothetical protein